jgi:hypothetical protein
MVLGLAFTSAAAAQESLSFFYGGSASFISAKAADADADAERSTVLAANPSILFELSDRLYVGGQAFLSDNGDVSDFAFDPQAMYLLGDAGTIPYVQGGLQDITGSVSYGGAVGILAPWGGTYVDASLFYRRLQGANTDGDVIGMALGFRLKYN